MNYTLCVSGFVSRKQAVGFIKWFNIDCHKILKEENEELANWQNKADAIMTTTYEDEDIDPFFSVHIQPFCKPEHLTSFLVWYANRSQNDDNDWMIDITKNCNRVDNMVYVFIKQKQLLGTNNDE